jgi:hypothetical protein
VERKVPDEEKDELLTGWVESDEGRAARFFWRGVLLGILSDDSSDSQTELSIGYCTGAFEPYVYYIGDDSKQKRCEEARDVMAEYVDKLEWDMDNEPDDEFVTRPTSWNDGFNWDFWRNGKCIAQYITPAGPDHDNLKIIHDGDEDLLHAGNIKAATEIIQEYLDDPSSE